MNTLFDQSYAETETNDHGEGADLSYWALFAESIQPELNLATPAVSTAD